MKKNGLTGILFRTAFLTALLLLLFGLMETPLQAKGNEDKRVLFISSYSYSWETVPLQIKGIQAGLGNEVTLDVEFMDTKSVEDEVSGRQFYKHMKYRLSKVPAYDGIIVGDDAALLFAMEHQEELFPDTPIAFEGVNDIEIGKKAAANPYISGVVEAPPYVENITFAKKVNPAITKVVALLDDTITGKGEREQFYQQASNFPELEFQEINASHLTREELEKELAGLTQDTMFVYLILSEDVEGRRYTNKEVVEIIKKYSPVPCYRFIQAGIGDGLLGGKIVSHEKSGEIAASILMDVFAGAPMKDVEMEPDSPNCFYFDQSVLERFHIDESLIPSDAVLVNQREKFWDKYGTAVLYMSVAFLVILTIILISVKMIFEKKRNVLLLAQSEAKSAFLSHMSHEIRTPLNACVGLTEVAQRHLPEVDKVAEDLGKMKEAAQLLLNIINNVLDMSAIESRKMKIERGSLDLEEVISAIALVCEEQCRQKRIGFTLDTEKMQYPHLLGDSLRVKQILLNLTNNACKFTPVGGSVSVTVTQRKMEKPPKAAAKAESTEAEFVETVFVVADTGVGMGEDMLERVFEPFEQESAGTAKKYGGSGLGMSITKNLVEMMSGTIQVESVKGEGTTFSVVIPSEMDREWRPVAEREERGEWDTRQYDFSGTRILLAEDNAFNRDIAVTLLDMVHVITDTAASGKEAVKMFVQAPAGTYDMILMDIQMPEMDGYEATQRIRESGHEEAKTIVIMAMTANVFVDDVKKAKNAGMNGHIAKPIDVEQLYRNIADTIQRKGD